MGDDVQELQADAQQSHRLAPLPDIQIALVKSQHMVLWYANCSEISAGGVIISPVILRCTAKLLTLLGVSSRELAVVEPSDADWYANLLWVDRRKCLLLAHAGTLFAILVADVRKTDLLPLGPLVVGIILRELRSEGLPTDTFGELDPHAIELARTASRTVLGYMNELKRSCEYRIAKGGGLDRCDIEQLNRELRRYLHLSRRPPGHFVPIDLVRSRSRP